MKSTLLASSLALATFVSTAAFAEPYIYVAAGSANKVLVIDAENNKVVNEFSDIANPHALVMTPDDEYVISGSLSTKENDKGEKEGTLYVIHPDHGHVMATYPLPGMIHHQAISPSGKYVVSTHPRLGGVSITNMEDDSDSKFLETGKGPNYTVFTKDGKRAYITNTGDGSISEVDTQSWQVLRTLKAGSTPEHMSLSNDESTLYVVNARAGTVSAVSVKPGEIEQTFKVGDGAHGLDLSEDGQSLFTTSKKSGIVVKIDLKSGKMDQLALSPSPYHLEALAGTGKVYVSSSKSPRIWVVDAKTFQKVDEIAIQGEGHQMAVTAVHTD